MKKRTEGLQWQFKDEAGRAWKTEVAEKMGSKR